MTNPTTEYKTWVYANLPSGMTYEESTQRFFVNEKSFFDYWHAKWYLDYITKFGFSGATEGEAPVATGGIADQTYTQGEVITPLNVASDFTGSGITYALAPTSYDITSVGLSINTSTGFITGTPTVTVSGVSVVVRGTNAFGFDDTAFSLTVNAAATTVENQAAEFGDGENAPYVPRDTSGALVPLASYDSLVAGDLEGFTPAISSGGLWFGSGNGAPANAVLRCTLVAGGTVDITVTESANTETFNDLDAWLTALNGAALTEEKALRAGTYNAAMERKRVRKTVDNTASWSAPTGLDSGNWTIGRPCTGENAAVNLCGMEFGSGTADYPHYVRLRFFISETPQIADDGGTGALTGGLSSAWRLDKGTHVAITDCILGHAGVTTGTSLNNFKGIVADDGYVWLENLTLNGFIKSVQGQFDGSSLIRNVHSVRCIEDSFYFTKCDGLLLEDCASYDKLFPFNEPVPIVGITRGNPTIIEVADTLGLNTNENIALVGINGTLGDLLNNRSPSCSTVTATTFTIGIDTTSADAWDELSGQVYIGTNKHGDHIQMPAPAAAGDQDNVTIRRFRGYRGNPGVPFGQDGQGLHLGLPGGAWNPAYARNNFTLEDSVFEVAGNNGANIQGVVGGRVRGNTWAPVIGIPHAGIGDVWIDENCQDLEFYDNTATAFSIHPSATFKVSRNNQELPTLSDYDAEFPSAGDLAIMAAAYVDPPTHPEADYDAGTAYVSKTNGTLDLASPKAGIFGVDYSAKTSLDPWGSHKAATEAFATDAAFGGLQEPVSIGASERYLTMRFDVTPDFTAADVAGLSDIYLCGLAGRRIALRIDVSDGSFDIFIHNGTSYQILPVSSLTVADATRQTIILSVDYGGVASATGTAEVWVDGTSEQETFTATTGFIDSGRKVTLVEPNASFPFVGEIYSAEVWRAHTADGDVSIGALGLPSYRVIGHTGGAYLEMGDSYDDNGTWKV